MLEVRGGELAPFEPVRRVLGSRVLLGGVVAQPARHQLEEVSMVDTVACTPGPHRLVERAGEDAAVVDDERAPGPFAVVRARFGHAVMLTAPGYLGGVEQTAGAGAAAARSRAWAALTSCGVASRRNPALIASSTTP